jgi:N6-adenosine-specific RNA methylase IME4
MQPTELIEAHDAPVLATAPSPGTHGFRVLVADCPWAFGDTLPGASRGAEKNYAVLSLDQIRNFPLPPMADDSYLFLWRVASMQEEALSVVRAWGFALKTELVWRKLTTTGKVWFGMGRTVRASHETCLIATRGKPARKTASIRSVFDAPVGKHSAKPEAFFDLVEALAPGPYVELFARRQRKGWICVGNEMPPPAVQETETAPVP